MSDLEKLPPAPKGTYRHYKGGTYDLIDVVRDSETLAPMVLYKPLYNESGMWVRPYEMFFGQVEVHGKLVRRFAPVQTT